MNNSICKILLYFSLTTPLLVVNCTSDQPPRKRTTPQTGHQAQKVDKLVATPGKGCQAITACTGDGCADQVGIPVVVDMKKVSALKLPLPENTTYELNAFAYLPADAMQSGDSPLIPLDIYHDDGQACPESNIVVTSDQIISDEQLSIRMMFTKSASRSVIIQLISIPEDGGKSILLQSMTTIDQPNVIVPLDVGTTLGYYFIPETEKAKPDVQAQIKTYEKRAAELDKLVADAAAKLETDVGTTFEKGVETVIALVLTAIGADQATQIRLFSSDYERKAVFVKATTRGAVAALKETYAELIKNDSLADVSASIVATEQLINVIVAISGTSNAGPLDSNTAVLTGFILPKVTLSSDAPTLVGETFSVTATFSQTVTEFTIADISAVNAAISNLVAKSGLVYTFDVAPQAAGSVTIDVNADAVINTMGKGNRPSNQLTRFFAYLGGVKTITSGSSHTCVLLDNSSIKCWGRNSKGQLGLGDTANRGGAANEMGRNLPTLDLGSERKALKVVAGGTHTCALMDDSNIKCWGGNSHGQLGRGDLENYGDSNNEMGHNLPSVDLGSGRTVQQFVIGGNNTCALLDDSNVKCWGDNTYGQLGLGGGNRGDSLNEMGDNLPAIDLGSGREATQIVSGWLHTCALLDDSNVKCWGDNTTGQLGRGDKISPNSMGDSLPVVDLGTGRKAIQITAGHYHTCVILDDSSVKCWGKNANGRLGVGHAMTLGDGSGEMGDNLPTISLGSGRKAIQIVGGHYHTCAILDDSSVKCWGGAGGLEDNEHRGDDPNEMGDNLPSIDLGTDRKALQIAIGDLHTCVILDNSSVKCWGKNESGELGLGDNDERGYASGEMGNNLKTVDIRLNRNALHVSAGIGSTCTILGNSSVKCWGNNMFGQLGQGDKEHRGDGVGEMGNNLKEIDLGSGRKVKQIETNGFYTCAILDNSSVKCWGKNDSGQLGQGDTENRGDGVGEMGDSLKAIDIGTGHKAIQISVGGYHTCALLADYSVRCWGENYRGQLGQQNTENRGDGEFQMGDHMAPIKLGTGRKATQISAGGLHTCALLDDSTIKCWGRNSFGELGQGDTEDRGDYMNEMGDNLLAIDLGDERKPLQVAAGYAHACALLDDSSVKCWGRNFSGELGQGDTENRGDDANEMGDNLPAIDLGSGRKALQIVASDDYTCVLLDNFTVKCWGENDNGQLGRGDAYNRGDNGSELGDRLLAVPLGAGQKVLQISANANHCCALLDNSSIKCWGLNVAGQLGLGDRKSRGGNAGELGEFLPPVDYY